MALVDDIATIRARGDLTEEQKSKRIASLKSVSLLDVILNGKPAPQPIPALLGREFTTRDGVTVIILSVSVGVAVGNIITIKNPADLDAEEQGDLFITMRLTRPPANPVTKTVRFVNPPILPAIIDGNEKRDLITAASEMIEGLV